MRDALRVSSRMRKKEGIVSLFNLHTGSPFEVVEQTCEGSRKIIEAYVTYYM